MSDPFVVRSVTVAEVIDDDGSVQLTITTEGEPPPHIVAGLLYAGLRNTSIELDANWQINDRDDD